MSSWPIGGERQDRQNWHFNLTFQVAFVGQLSQFLRCFCLNALSKVGAFPLGENIWQKWNLLNTLSFRPLCLFKLVDTVWQWTLSNNGHLPFVDIGQVFSGIFNGKSWEWQPFCAMCSLMDESYLLDFETATNWPTCWKYLVCCRCKTSPDEDSFPTVVKRQ